MKLRGARWAVALAASRPRPDGMRTEKNDGTTPGQVSMDDQQAIARAEEKLQQAVDGMTPRPTLEVVGRRRSGPCLAPDAPAEDAASRSGSATGSPVCRSPRRKAS